MKLEWYTQTYEDQGGTWGISWAEAQERKGDPRLTLHTGRYVGCTVSTVLVVDDATGVLWQDETDAFHVCEGQS